MSLGADQSAGRPLDAREDFIDIEAHSSTYGKKRCRAWCTGILEQSLTRLLDIGLGEIAKVDDRSIGNLRA